MTSRDEVATFEDYITALESHASLSAPLLFGLRLEVNAKPLMKNGLEPLSIEIQNCAW